MSKKILLKMGGIVFENKKTLQQICRDITKLQAEGNMVVIIHGGGYAINKALDQHHLTSTFYDGLRITTPAMMEVIEKVLNEEVNQSIVDKLQELGQVALSLKGNDEIFLCEKYSSMHQRVGKVMSINVNKINHCLNARIIPVITPVGTGCNGEAMNINADWAASVLALALNVDQLIYLTDQDGILDADKKNIPQADFSLLQQLILSQTVKAGMLTKVRAIIHALSHGIANIHIINALKPHALMNMTQQPIGTSITQRANLCN